MEDARVFVRDGSRGQVSVVVTSKVVMRVMVSTDSTSTGNTHASRRNMVSVAAAYWCTPELDDPVVTITPGGGDDAYGPDGNRNMSVFIPTRPPPPVICTTLAAASMSSLPGHRHLLTRREKFKTAICRYRRTHTVR